MGDWLARYPRRTFPSGGLIANDGSRLAECAAGRTKGGNHFLMISRPSLGRSATLLGFARARVTRAGRVDRGICSTAWRINASLRRQDRAPSGRAGNPRRRISRDKRDNRRAEKIALSVC